MAKRDNEYWTSRLEKDGHNDLLDQVKTKKITVYKATQLAGYRSIGPRTPAAKLSHHWKRASHEERKRFVQHHLIELNNVGREVLASLRSQTDKKSGS